MTLLAERAIQANGAFRRSLCIATRRAGPSQTRHLHEINYFPQFFKWIVVCGKMDETGREKQTCIQIVRDMGPDFLRLHIMKT